MTPTITCAECHKTRVAPSRYRPTLCRECANLTARLWRLAVRKDAVAAYGGACHCCGETSWPFLTLAWPNPAEGGRARPTIAECSLLRTQGFPKGALVAVCYGCTAASDYFGVCPHRMTEAQRQLLDEGAYSPRR